MNAMKLAGKVILVTGASKGIGADIAREAANQGAKVLINYNTDREGAEQVLSDITRAGGHALVLKADVGSRDQVEAMVHAGIGSFGKIDVLVNNAGIALWKPFLEIDEQSWDRTIDVNLKGAFLCSQAVCRKLVSQKLPGSIVNISSIAAHGSLDCLVPYCASKGGMTLMTRSMAVELASHGIRVNAVAPGTIDIERNRATDPAYPDDWIPFIPLGRVGTTQEVAKPVLFLASDEASFITGQVIWVDGGETSYVPMPRADFARGSGDAGGPPPRPNDRTR